MTEKGQDTGQSKEMVQSSSIEFRVTLNKQHLRKLSNSDGGFAAELIEDLPDGMPRVILAVSNADGNLLCDASIQLVGIAKAQVMQTLIEQMNQDTEYSEELRGYRMSAMTSDPIELLYTVPTGSCLCVGIYDLGEEGIEVSITNNFPNRSEGRVIVVPTKIDEGNVQAQVNSFYNAVSSVATSCLRAIGNAEGGALVYNVRPKESHYDLAAAFYEAKYSHITGVSDSEQVPAENFDLFLDHFVGYEPQREEVEQFIELFLHRDVAEAWGVHGPSSLLIRGPAGTGKSLLTREICDRIGGNVHEVSASEIVDKYVGETAKNIDGFFKNVVTLSETTTQIVVLKPLEAFATANDGVQSERGSAAVSLANWIRTINEEYPNVIILGITCDTQVASSLVSDSFEERISLGEPNDSDRFAIWSSLLFNVSMRVGPGKLSPTVGDDIDKLVTASGGMSGRDIVGVMRSALRDRALGQIMLGEAPAHDIAPLGLGDLLMQIRRFGTSR